MSKTKMTRGLILAFPLTLIAFFANANDYPHNDVNNITCLSCHNIHGFTMSLLKLDTPLVPQNIDDTEANNLCRSCHNDTTAPSRKPHSSHQIDNGYGDWAIECKICHNPHQQRQVRVYGSEGFMASGTISSATTTTITSSGAGWTADEFAGRVVVVNYPVLVGSDKHETTVGSYRVTGNSSDTLTIDPGLSATGVDTGLITPGVTTYAIIYGKLIRDEVSTPDRPTCSVTNNVFSCDTRNLRTVKFLRPTGNNSFADSDTVYDGICQVCHTMPNHMRYDGSAPDQTHQNVGGATGLQCTANCHLHTGGFGHGLGGGGTGGADATVCVKCHGHEAGTLYDPTATAPYTPGTEASQGRGTTTPHSTHTESWTNMSPASAGDDDKRGPAIYCNVCHDTANMPTFNSGTDLDGDGLIRLNETDVCDECHSPGGTYNGVDSVGDSVGAKDNWHTGGVYDSVGNLMPGKEKWCAGCHDETPSVIANQSSVSAPSVIGDEDGDYTYGTGWGFYKTGHGVPSTETIPASGGVKSGPGRNCPDCHDTTRRHIDGNPRSFDCSDGCDPAEYGEGYRLQLIGGLDPMVIPRPWSSPTMLEKDFLLCFNCHDYESVTDTADSGNGPQTSNYYDNSNNPANLHYYHLRDSSATRISADWSGSWNSRMSCILCHNPHGTKNLAMIRTGELVGNSPIQIWYYNNSIPTQMVYGWAEPVPPNVTLAASDGTVLVAPSTNDYCNGHCHGLSNLRYISRTPFQNTDQVPQLDWAGTPGFELDGVDPDSGVGGTDFTFRVEYTDTNNDAPTTIEVWVDVNDNGTYEDPSERFTLNPAAVDPQPYISGVDYITTLNINKALSSDGVIKYRFYANDVHGDAVGDPTNDSTLSLLNAAPTLSWTGADYYVSDGVNPDIGGHNANFTFKVTYTDSNNEAPASLPQLWIDLDGSGDYNGVGEKVDMNVESGDGNYANGENYAKIVALGYVGATGGLLNYTFRADDGTDSATGTPTSDHTVKVLSTSNTPPFLEWVGESCRTDGALPDNGLATGDFDFKVRYTSLSNTAPTSIQVWVDSDGDLTKEGHTLTLQAGGDGNHTNGEIYAATVTLNAAGTQEYYFTASDGTENAVGDPTAIGTYSVTVMTTGLMKGVRSGTGENGPIWYDSIQNALDASPNGGGYTILVYPGTYVGSGHGLYFDQFGDTVTDIKSVCGPELTTIQAGSGSNYGVYAYRAHNSSVDGFQITGGAAGGLYIFDSDTFTTNNSWIHDNPSTGVSISANKSLNLTNSKIYNNTSRGIVLNGNAVHTLSNLEIYDNSVSGTTGAGMFIQNVASPGTYSNITLRNNTNSTDSGGGIYFNGVSNVTFDKCRFIGNSAAGSGGAFFGGNSKLTFTNCIFADNTAGTTAGAIGYNGSGYTLDIVNSTFANNRSNGGDGGMMWNQNSAVTIANSIFWGNSASTGSGHVAYSNGGSVSISDSIIQNDEDGTDNASITDAPYFQSTNITWGISGYRSDNDPNFVDAANSDYHIQVPSDAIDNASAVSAPAEDIDGETRPQLAGLDDIGADETGAGAANQVPTLAWTGETDFTGDGVNPDSDLSGNSFEFRIAYTDNFDVAPALIQVWVDLNRDDAYGEGEKFDLTETDAGDTVYSDGKLYSTLQPLTLAGGGTMNYRFFASNGSYQATGVPTANSTVTVTNHIPSLAWTGETDYISDGANPETVVGGGNITFRIDYTDADNTAPNPIQVWIDKDDSGDYDEGEKITMTAAAGGDGDYTNGERFEKTVAIPFVGSGAITYRFYASDGVDAATGTPATTDKSLTVTTPVNDGPTLAWTTATCLTDGARPSVGSWDSDIEFKVSFSDATQCAADIQVWVDKNDNGIYDTDEKFDLTEENSGDVDCSDGKLYSATLPLSYAGDGIFNYRFYATDGLEAATGIPVATGGTVTLLAALKVRPSGGHGWYSTIGAAANASATGQTVLVYPDTGYTPATYTESIAFSALQHNRTLKSVCGPDLTIISSGATNAISTSYIVGLVVDGFTLTGSTYGFYADGGHTLTVKNSKLQGNSYGLYANNGTTVSLENSEVYSNSIRGIHTNSSTTSIDISGTEIYSNGGGDNAGAGIYFNYGVHTITDSIIRNNNTTGTAQGAGIFFNGTGAGTTVTNTVFKNNTATWSGSGVSINNGSYVNFRKCSFIGNTSSTGAGAAYINGSTPTFENCIIADNSAPSSGGIYLNTGSMQFVNTTFANNSATSGTGGGGAIGTCAGSASVTLKNALFYGNTATGSGNNINKICGGSTSGSISDSMINTGAGWIDGGGFNTSGTLYAEVDPLFVDEAGGDYHLTEPSPARDKANPFDAPLEDIDGDPRPKSAGQDDLGADEWISPNTPPVLSWTNESGSYASDGVDPDSGANLSTNFVFRVNYTDVDSDPPTSIQVWIDENDDSVEDAGEFYNLTLDTGSTYSVTRQVAYAGDGTLNYRFAASDGTDAATGDPVTVLNTLTLTNTTPTLGWTGETNYTADGAHPDTGTNGSTFVFRVDYFDEDNDPPTHIQVWVDEDNSSTYESGEKYNMTAEGPDSDYTTAGGGRRYLKNLPLNGNGATINYRFYASDSNGGVEATGAPATGGGTLTITNSSPSLAWLGSGNYVSDGIDPDSAVSGSTFTFKVKYTDSDDNPPSVIYVWVDADDSGTYADPGERTSLSLAAGGDGDYTNGETFETSMVLSTIGTLSYYFEASDGYMGAFGAPATSQNFDVLNNVPDTPVNANYSSGETGVGLTPTLNASVFSDADGDSHQASQFLVDNTDATCPSPEYDSGTLGAVTSHTVGSTLTFNTQYYWCVRYQDNRGGWSNYSAGGSGFTTQVLSDPPNTPSNTSPKDGDTVASVTPTLIATAFSDPNAGDTHLASQWLVDDDNFDSTCSTPEYDSGPVAAGTSHVVASALNYSATYHWCVRYQDSNGVWSNYSSELFGFVTPAPNSQPDTPTASNYVSGETGVSTTPTLNASAFSDPDAGDTHAASQFVVDSNNDCTAPFAYDSGTLGAVTSHAVGSALSNSTTYYWCVRYQDNNGSWSGYSSPGTGFTTAAPNSQPNTPTASNYISGETDVSTTPTLNASAFSDPDVGDTHAASQFVVDSNNDCTGPFVYDSGTLGAVTGHAVGSALGNSTTYYWCARYQDNNGAWSNYSSPGTGFTTEAAPVAGTTYSVCGNLPAPYDKIQTAIADADTVSGDTLVVCDGTYAEKIDFLGKDITLKSASGAAYTTLAGDGTNNPVVNFNGGETASAVLDGFTINNSNDTGANHGNGGIKIQGGSAPTIKNAIIVGNDLSAWSADGAAIYINGGSATIQNCTIGTSALPNLGRWGAGIYAVNSALDFTVTDTTISYNTASATGGGIYLSAMTGTNTITNTTINNNAASSTYGGGIYLAGMTAATVITDSAIDNNSANKGGGIYSAGSPVSLTDTSVDNNSATNEGGGIRLDGEAADATITRGSVDGNTGSNGLGFYLLNGADVTYTGGSISGNTSAVAASKGGGIYVVHDNTTLNLSKLTIQGNKVGQHGAGIYHAASLSSATVTNSMITGNAAGSSNWEDGGGIYSNGTLDVINSTIAGNYAGQGGGLYIAGGTATVKNSILWGNTAGVGSTHQIFGSPAVTYSDVQGGFTGTGNINADPLFVDPQAATAGTPASYNNLGVFHIQAGSPAADPATLDNPPADDIDGDTRDANPDMGADEVTAMVRTAVCGTDIQTAIGAAPVSNATIYVCPGSYANDIDFLGKAITLKSTGGAGVTTITGDGTNKPVVYFQNGESSSAVLDGFTIDNSYSNGTLSRGIEIINNSSPTIRNSVITGNSIVGNDAVTLGGGIMISGNSGTTTLHNTSISNNSSKWGGSGLYINASSVAMTGTVTVDGNSVIQDAGAGIWAENGSSLNINASGVNSSSISGNTATGNGGGIYFDGSSGGTLSIANIAIDSNDSTSNHSGGGLYLTNISSTTSITNVSISNNLSKWGGGAIYASAASIILDNALLYGNRLNQGDGTGVWLGGGSSATITNSAINGNMSNYSGLGIYMNGASGGTLSISDSTVINNLPVGTPYGSGGGIYLIDVAGTTAITNTIVSGNRVKSAGGGLYANASAVNINGSFFDNNYLNQGNGGGIFIDTASTIGTTHVRSNTAASGYGGGIYLTEATTIDKSVISGNDTLNDGGGIWASAALTLTNSFVTGNVTTFSGCCGRDGGGLFLSGTGTNTLTNVTIAGNRSHDYGGLYSSAGTTNIKNSILWGNTAHQGTTDLTDNHAAGTGVTVTYSDVQDGWTTEPTNQSVDPQFVDFDPNGKVTGTTGLATGDFHIQDTSPVGNAGDTAGAPADDIDGETRDGSPDLGADENLAIVSSMVATLHPSGVAQYSTASNIDDVGTFIPYGGTWADVFDTNDGDTSRTDKCCDGGPNNADTEWMAVNIDDLSALTGGADPGTNPTIVSLKFYVRARYNLQGGPEPRVNQAHTFKVGYTTATTTPPAGTVPNIDAEHTTSGSGTNHQLFTSSTYTTGLTLADIDNLLIWVRYDKTVNHNLRVTEIYAEVEYIPGN